MIAGAFPDLRALDQVRIRPCCTGVMGADPSAEHAASRALDPIARQYAGERIRMEL